MKANPITFAELSKRTLGSTVTWAELIPLIAAAERVHVCFHAHNGATGEEAEYLGRSLEIPKAAALERAEWAAERHAADGECVNVSACAGTLWFGSH